jgi:hypothetical protein
MPLVSHGGARSGWRPGSKTHKDAPENARSEADRRQNQIGAFKQVYGREPVSANDWGMAAALDPHSYDPKYQGVPPGIVVGRLTPQLQWNAANSGSALGPATGLERHHWVGDATIPPVRPNMPGWLWELENVDPFQGDPFLSHTTQLTNPFRGGIPTVAVGR